MFSKKWPTYAKNRKERQQFEQFIAKCAINLFNLLSAFSICVPMFGCFLLTNLCNREKRNWKDVGDAPLLLKGTWDGNAKTTWVHGKTTWVQRNVHLT
jgi:hypothetical protein